MNVAAQILSTYNNLNLDNINFSSDVLALFDCNAARMYQPQAIYASEQYGWVVKQAEVTFLGTFQFTDKWYHSSTVDGVFKFTGKTSTHMYGESFIPNNYKCAKNEKYFLEYNLARWPLPGEVLGTLNRAPLNILGSESPVINLKTNVDIVIPEVIGTNGTDFYIIGNINSPTVNNPNQVWKSSDGGVTWTYLGQLSGVDLGIYKFGDFSYQTSTWGYLWKIGSRWFLSIPLGGTASDIYKGSRLFYTDNSEPVSGWQPAIGLELPEYNPYERFAIDIGFDGINTLYKVKEKRFVFEIYKSTDNGTSWSIDYTATHIPGDYGSYYTCETTLPSIGGKVRIITNYNVYEHIIGSPDGTWTVKSLLIPKPIWDTETAIIDPNSVIGPPIVFINKFNSDGMALGNSTINQPINYNRSNVTTLTYTNGPDSDCQINTSPIDLYGFAGSFLANMLYPVNMPKYSGAYIDTSMNKFSNVPGFRRHNTAPASLKCAGQPVIVTISSDWNVGAANWTIDFWMYTDAANQNCTILNTIDGAGYGWFDFKINNGNIGFACYDQNKNYLANFNFAIPLPVNNWNFIAVTRSSDTITLYLNGISVASAAFLSSSKVYYSSSTTLNIGGYSNYSGAFDGWVGGFRVTKNVVRYKQNFDLPWRTFPDTGGPVPLS